MKPMVTCLGLGLAGSILVLASLFHFISFTGSNLDLSTCQPTAITSESVTARPGWAIFPDSPRVPCQTEAIYQPFERGFMAWRSDKNCVYAIEYSPDDPNSRGRAVIPAELPGWPHGNVYSYGYCLTVEPLTARHSQVTPPPGLMQPAGVLGKVWNYYGEIRTRLGCATQPERRYVAVIPANDETPSDGMLWNIPQMTLPNGHILRCGSRAASAGTCLY
jgi:hypothetical protein